MAFDEQQRRQIARNIQLARTRKFIFDVKGISSPVSTEASYYRTLKRLVRELTNALKSKVLPILKQSEPDYVKDGPIEDLVDRTLAGILTSLGDLDKEATRISTAMTTRVENFNRRKFVTDINRAVGINIADIVNKDVALPTLEASVKANVDLIKTIPPQYFERVQKAITQGLQKGDDFFSVRKNILEIGESTNSRARIIARDQVTKLNAALTEQRQKALGISEYTWRTAGDDRVRPDHEDNDGKVFAWSDPPSTGHPGTDILCRCIAEPKLDHLLSSAEGEPRRHGKPPKLKGTEKQVAWASDIREGRLAELDALKELPIPKGDPVLEILATIESQYLGADHAAWWITLDQNALSTRSIANAIAKGGKDVKWPVERFGGDWEME